jgi:CRISPR-associated exonuclease Cas4
VIPLLNFNELKTTGTQVQYYLVCQRKLWLSSHQITFEQDSDRVLEGKVLHERSYNYKKSKEVMIENLIKIDLYDSKYVGEVKSSSKMQDADRAQLLYYLYVLKQYGIERKGRMHYPKEKKIEEIELLPKDEARLEELLLGIKEVTALAKPPKAKKLPYCPKCAYYHFCWVGEE